MQPEDLNEVSAFLSIGELAPFKDVRIIDDLTISERNFWVKKLSDLYKKQKQEMDKIKSQRRSRR